MIIRALEARDRDNWRRLWTDYLGFYKTEVSEEVFEASFDRLLSDDPNQYRGLIAEQDGTAIGLAHYLVHRDLWSLSDTCYLSDLFVDPKARGSGAGRALIDAVAREAKAAGAASLHWLTQESNATARGLYDQIAELQPYVQYHKSL